MRSPPTRKSREKFHLKRTRGWRRYSPLRVRLAEWSKASVLRADGGNVAWVRIPHLANYFLSFKAQFKLLNFMHCVIILIKRLHLELLQNKNNFKLLKPFLKNYKTIS